MKAKVTSLIVVLLLSTMQIWAQKQITVEAKNNDISNNLDLQAVASIFGDSKDLQEFEMKLNDFDSQISNLDLNNDGEVDYLRVIETTDNNTHLVVIQAVLEKDVFQDVASILVERKDNRRTIVQVIGSPYMYGENYIIEPVYGYTPSIYSYFWRRSYSPWISPFYWGYYPRYYHTRRPFELDIYATHIHSHINYNHHYYYTERQRYSNYDQFYKSISRNDYGVRYPDRSFTSRNSNIRNRQEYDNRYKTNNILLSRPTNEVSRRYSDDAGRSNGTRNSSYSRNANARTSSSVSTQPSTQYSPKTTTTSPRNTVAASRTQPTTIRSEKAIRSTPTVKQPSRNATPQSEVRTQSAPSRSTESRTESSNRTSGQTNTGRR